MASPLRASSEITCPAVIPRCAAKAFAAADSQPGTYLAAAGDFFGDGVEDILWDNAAETVMWDHHYVGTSPQRLGWLWTKTAPAGAPAERSATPTAPGLAPADGTASGTPVGPLPGR